MILSAQTIRHLCVPHPQQPHPLASVRLPMIDPFCERTVAFGKTYGLSAAGYDVRIAQDITLPGLGRLQLASTIEKFNMPEDVLAVVHDKSSWARRGITVQNTVIEPGWRGYLTIELTNHTDEVVVVPCGSPIAQIVFHRLDSPSAQPYNGKYQDQGAGPQPAITEQP